MKSAWLALMPALLGSEPLVAQVNAPIVIERPAASPAARPFGSTQPRMPKTLTEPLALGRANATPAPQRPPLPDRSIEAPRDRFATNNYNPTLEPMLIPPERRQGMTFGREHLRETGPDRPFDNLVPGARLRIPFESPPPGR
jgi:hypothetical protein